MITAALLLLFIAQPVEDPWTTLEGTTPAQWRLVWTDRPSQELTISWSTFEAGEEHAVLYDTVSRVGEKESYAARAPAHRSGQYTLDETEVGKITSAHYHHARITGLEPSTTYWFQIQSDGERSRELHFQTGPD
ncbi:MAG: fibronectin type III domain-containing protein, partial [Planctomycetota bacterium]|nr:fibronectin type III domain-containing protein [Planctomycetota bacterium]